MSEDVKRGPGRPRKEPAAPRPQTAQERIDEIRLLEFQGGGYIVPRPAELTIQTFLEWMRQTAEIGNGDHVAIVWEKGNQSLAWRQAERVPAAKALRNQYDELCKQAWSRWAKLQAAADEEARVAKLEYEARTKAANHQRAIAKKEAELAALRATQ